MDNDAADDDKENMLLLRDKINGLALALAGDGIIILEQYRTV